ncbi:MAG TPA: hypothetical protein PLS84_00945 [Salinivirgaceae bacterium]|nr:hypothetical protein [Salinivirgaceae bacterium]
MKRFLISLSLVFVFSLSFRFDPIHAQTTQPTANLTKEQYAKLNAMIVVGSGIPLSPNIEKLEKYLRDLGVNVYTFYHPNAVWDDIIKVDKPIHIFVYNGHGTDKGDYGSPGGFILSHNRFISSKEIKRDLPLAKNAIVLLKSACMSMGSSADDNKEVSLERAIYRVESYSKPFIEMGSSIYFATGLLVQEFLEGFFKGEPAIEVYKKAGGNRQRDIKTIQPYSLNNLYELSVAASMPACRYLIIDGDTIKADPFMSYDKAFVGKPTFTVLEFLKGL